MNKKLVFGVVLGFLVVFVVLCVFYNPSFVDNAVVNSRVVFVPQLCVDTPWEAWYRDGGIRYIREPSDEELITDYYAHQYQLSFVSLNRSSLGSFSCSACGCSRGYKVEAVVMSVSDRKRLVADGWVAVKE